MSLYEELVSKQVKMSVIGLGYVGLPLALSFAKKVDVIAFDTDKQKISSYKNGIDVTGEVDINELKRTNAYFTTDENTLRESRFHVIAVPTPVSVDKIPDLTPVINASKTVGRNLTKGSFIVYESTVFPGVTEDICIPILESESCLHCGTDFKVGYSPERINPGDKIHRLETIVKIVSGIDIAALDIIAEVYALIVEAGVYRAESIKIAEAAKVIENAQRDVNIAFMNELSMVFNKMNIDTKSVLNAARTKWNFLDFKPGLVGGHCIAVDPYYFIYKAEQLGYHSRIILDAREINDDISKYIVESIIKCLIKKDKKIKGSRAVILGFSYKENSNDVRNTKVIDIVKGLSDYGIDVDVIDPLVKPDSIYKEYQLGMSGPEKLEKKDIIIFAVPHKAFDFITLEYIKSIYDDLPVIIDIGSRFSRAEAERSGFIYWCM